MRHGTRILRCLSAWDFQCRQRHPPRRRPTALVLQNCKVQVAIVEERLSRIYAYQKSYALGQSLNHPVSDQFGELRKIAASLVGGSSRGIAEQGHGAILRGSNDAESGPTGASAAAI